MIGIKNNRLRFEVTEAALKHSALAAAINCVALGLGLWLSEGELPVKIAALLCFAGGIWYSGRETGDLEKSYRWKLRPINTKGDQWNSAELLMPLLTCAAMASALFLIGGL